MGWQIIKRPDGKYAVWSSVVDDFIEDGLCRDGVLALFAQEAVFDSIRHTSEKLDEVDKSEKPYHQFTMTYDEAKKLRDEIHGEESNDAVHRG